MSSEISATPEPPLKRRRTGHPSKPPKCTPPLYKAEIKELADIGSAQGACSTADIDNAIINRIKNCLARANHPETPEAQAKAALHLASRMMGQYNVSQAEVMAHESLLERKQYAGQSIVSIRRYDQDYSKAVRFQNFVEEILDAMEVFFDCKSYSTTFVRSLNLTFYGIASNTVAAAMAFEMAYNLIVEWTRDYKGAARKNSYCMGVSEGLLDLGRQKRANEEAEAEKAEADALAARIDQEEAERDAQLSRLADLPEDLPISEVNDRSSIVTDNRARSHSHSSNRIGLTPDLEDSVFGSDPESGARGDALDEDSDDYDNFNEIDDDYYEYDEAYVNPDFTVKESDTLDVDGDIDEEIARIARERSATIVGSPVGKSSPSLQPLSPPRTATAPHSASKEQASAHNTELEPEVRPT